MSASAEHEVFAERLRAAMAMRGWTRLELGRRYNAAARLSLAPGMTSLGNYVTGKAMPRARTLRILCDVLDVSADWLLGRTAAFEPPGTRAARLDEADRLAVAQYIDFLTERAERRRSTDLRILSMKPVDGAPR